MRYSRDSRRSAGFSEGARDDAAFALEEAVDRATPLSEVGSDAALPPEEAEDRPFDEEAFPLNGAVGATAFPLEETVDRAALVSLEEVDGEAAFSVEMAASSLQEEETCLNKH